MRRNSVSRPPGNTPLSRSTPGPTPSVTDSGKGVKLEKSKTYWKGSPLGDVATDHLDARRQVSLGGPPRQAWVAGTPGEVQVSLGPGGALTAGSRHLCEHDLVEDLGRQHLTRQGRGRTGLRVVAPQLSGGRHGCGKARRGHQDADRER